MPKKKRRLRPDINHLKKFDTAGSRESKSVPQSTKNATLKTTVKKEGPIHATKRNNKADLHDNFVNLN